MKSTESYIEAFHDKFGQDSFGIVLAMLKFSIARNNYNKAKSQKRKGRTKYWFKKQQKARNHFEKLASK